MSYFLRRAMSTRPDLHTVSLITGASSGFGLSLSKLMVARGSKVVLGDINYEKAAEVAEGLNKGAGEKVAMAYKVDTSVWEQQVDMFAAGKREFGRIDYVFANAGIGEDPFLPNPLPSDDKIVKPSLRTLDINLSGQLYSGALALQYFSQQSPGSYGFKGKLVFTASVFGFYPCASAPMYAAAKAAIVSFTRSAAASHGQDGITINAVCPNFVRTAIMSKEFFDILESKQLLTEQKFVDEAFESLVGDSKANGLTIGVNQNGIYTHPQDSYKWEENRTPLEAAMAMIAEGQH